ncbi:MAG: Hydroxymethylglutaryl-CoA reductase [Candidatus Ozemobacter sibiricus]|uniref:hydroxymethylglutaryl-CoA reductase (NADPH) n=1 Tax=Candidatus Ozemobacter sibiricus TaxID=2268124 RepID=A0A367ZNN0_9BACT|nr:MAG: Hydroxymethylglutaryl-CoA reductase [Candidatus Ozemobacter sibiricus]
MFEQTLRLTTLPVEPAKVAMSCDLGEGRWVDMTYGEFREIVEEVGRLLATLGVGRGDRILIVGENHFKWLPVFVGITGYGAVAVPVDGMSADQRLLAIVEDCRPAAIMVSRRFQERWAGLYPQLTHACPLINFQFEILKTAGQMPSPVPAPPPPVETDPAAIIYTSGTTGQPKGVILNHAALVAAVQLGKELGDFTRHDVMLAVLPFTHVFGLVDAGLAPLALGGRVVLTTSLNPGEILGAVLKYRVSFALLVPRLAEVLVSALRAVQVPLPRLTVIIGGAACSAALIEAFRSRGIRTMQGFGMTETAGGIIMNQDGPPESIGKPLPAVQVKIDQPNQEGVGELLVAAPSLLSGIWGRPELNSDLFAGEFLRTGDLASIDENGYVYIRGRAKDVIIPAGGMNVYPDELEARLGVLPFAEEYSVLGLKEGGYEFPALVIKPRADWFAQHQLAITAENLHDEIAARTRDWPEWERFRRVILLEQPLPRSSSFKVQRHLLAERVTAGTGQPATSAARSEAAAGAVSPSGAAGGLDAFDRELFDRFRGVVAHFLNVPSSRITPTTRLSEFLQLDSLGVIALLAHLEEVFGLSLQEMIGQEIRDFGTLFAFMKRDGQLDKLREVERPTSPSVLPPPLDFSPEALKARQQFLQQRVAGNIKAIPRPDDPLLYAGNIEAFFGFCQVPLGLVGPLKVLGEHAQGEFYIPLATTEGALVSSIARGAQVITMAGGVRAKVVADSLVRAPMFVFNSIPDMAAFSDWVAMNFPVLKEVAESTTRFGKLEQIEPFPMGSSLCLRFVYSTGDASGQNMTTIATHKAIQHILKEYKGQIADWFLETNLSGDKKINGVNFTRNRGKRVIAEVAIPDAIVEKVLHTTSERMLRLSQVAQMSALHSHSFGSQAHYANVLAAVFIACGQDPACVAESATGVTHLERRDGHLVVSVTMPGLMIGTVGGGTRLPTQQLCLQIMECDGPRKARKMAEIVAGAVVAGEISLIGAMAADQFADAHARYGRPGGQR